MNVMAFLEHKPREGQSPWLAALGVSSLMFSFHREIFPWSPAGTPAWEISLPWAGEDAPGHPLCAHSNIHRGVEST